MRADAAAGERLAAARCATCHASTETIHSTVPRLEGQPRAAFIAQWNAFRDRKRAAPVMLFLADELGANDVEDLAAYYASRPIASAAAAGSDAGRALTEQMGCASCHGPAMEGAETGAARLAGQKARYLAWALQSMRSGSRPHGNAPTPDPMLVKLGNDDIEALAAHLSSIP